MSRPALCVVLLRASVCACSLSLGGLAGPVKAAGSSVRVCIWVIRSPETLRVRFAFAFPILVPNQDTGQFSVFWFVFVINLRMSVGPFWAFVCIVNGNSV